ncbi:MAG: nucleotidyltransferase family protein [Thermosynechococcaceae cyanobacterium]
MNKIQSTRQAITDRIFHDRAHRPELLEQRATRQQQGWEVAQQAAQILKDQFGVQRVVLFGSMLDINEINWRSDIDLAVWGLGKFDLFKAGAAIDRGHDFAIDLVPAEEARPHIRLAIKQGVEL